jgi:hypothetical protein
MCRAGRARFQEQLAVDHAFCVPALDMGFDFGLHELAH